MKSEVQIPLFPLGVVLMPGLDLPLHIFEERYKQMIGECLSQDHAFGIVFYEGRQMHPIGCSARITEIVRQYDDGRMDIVTRGEQRFRILSVSDRRPYLEATVSFFEDDWEPLMDSDQSTVAEATRLLHELELRLYGGGVDHLPPEADMTALSFRIAGHDAFQAAEKQKFLEMTSSRQRLTRSMLALTKIVQRLRLTEDIQKIIGGNGHVPDQLRKRFNQDS